jgi:hypothetical protein
MAIGLLPAVHQTLSNVEGINFWKNQDSFTVRSSVPVNLFPYLKVFNIFVICNLHMPYVLLFVICNLHMPYVLLSAKNLSSINNSFTKIFFIYFYVKVNNSSLIIHDTPEVFHTVHTIIFPSIYIPGFQCSIPPM